MTETISRTEIQAEELPDSWAYAAYSELGEWFGGGTPSKANPEFWKDGNVPWFSPKDMRGLELHDSQDHITEIALDDSAAKPVRAGSLLFVVRSGILRRTLPVALTRVDGAVNQDIKALTPSKRLSVKYLLYATLAQREEIRHRCKKAGTTVESIQVPSLQAFRLPIAPLNEQHRIVEKIEELFTKLDAGVRSLEQTRALLKSYRRSVLKAAVEGELSREWREAHQNELEPASELLARILQERREKFAGKKYKEPAAPDNSKLPALPDGWEWASLGQLLSGIEAGKNFKCREKPPDGTELGLVKISSVTWGVFNEAESKTVTDLNQENREHLINEGDFLFSRANTLELVGACVIVHAISKRLMLSDKVLRFRFVKDTVKRWSMFYLRSYRGRQQIESLATGNQLSMRNISQASIHRIAVPLPSAAEMGSIVKEIERRLSVVDKLEATVEENLKQAGGLRQSILKRAFSGGLVPQDPDDEPAGMLLERIGEERQATKPKVKKGAGARRKASADEWVPELFPSHGG